MESTLTRLRKLDHKFRTDGLYGDEVKEYQDAFPKLLAVADSLPALINAVDCVPTQDEYLEPFLREQLDRCRDALAALEVDV